jgi:excinuclease ABC subunit C
MNDVIREKLKQLPEAPGCYLMKDEAGRIIYVGKAVNLKNRVRSYFHGSHDPKTARLVEKIVDLETVVVKSEAEALILEANLIKEHEPHYNILMRDDKHYPYLKLTMAEEFPRLLVARRARSDGSKYFGPYTTVGSIHKARELVQDIFSLRSCSGGDFSQNRRSCLNAHIGRCSAPCEGKISREDYAKIVEQVALFLQGKMPELIRQRKRQMDEAAAAMRFEEAARHRDALAVLISLASQQEIDSHSGQGNFDVISVVAAEGQSIVQIFFVRHGTVTSRDHFSLTGGERGGEALILRRFLQEYYGGGDRIPAELYVSQLPEDAAILEQALAASAGHKVRIAVPQRGNKLRLLRLVQENARLTLVNYLNTRERQEQRNSLALEELKEVLNLEASPRRIECYDISHIQGSDMVGSMVVFINGAATPKLYRHFRIKTLSGSNDFAALQEVLERRWKRGLAERELGKQPLDFGDLPELIVIDGGKGQLSAVIERLAEFPGKKPHIISLAKQFEEIYQPGNSEPLCLPHETQALQLLQRLRDEAHRFAITYHRRLRGKRQIMSLLDQAPGIGEQRRQSLLKTFGSLKSVNAASEEELAAAPLMNKKAAHDLFAFLHQDEAGKAED